MTNLLQLQLKLIWRSLAVHRQLTQIHVCSFASFSADGIHDGSQGLRHNGQGIQQQPFLPQLCNSIFALMLQT